MQYTFSECCQQVLYFILTQHDNVLDDEFAITCLLPAKSIITQHLTISSKIGLPADKDELERA